jgi:hypothetical protein
MFVRSRSLRCAVMRWDFGFLVLPRKLKKGTIVALDSTFLMVSHLAWGVCRNNENVVHYRWELTAGWFQTRAAGITFEEPFRIVIIKVCFSAWNSFCIIPRVRSSVNKLFFWDERGRISDTTRVAPVGLYNALLLEWEWNERAQLYAAQKAAS